MENNFLQSLDEIEFHDLAIKSLTLDFESKSCKFMFEEYDSVKQIYCPLEINFYGLSKFISKYPSEFDFKVGTCYSMKYEKQKDSLYELEFLFELTSLQPVYSLTICFTSLTVKRTLSDKAIEFKNTGFDSKIDERLWLEKNSLAV
ncbi:MAG: hypothetical protein KBF93_26210 [Leptospiraceae bacterium]|jgi:hypothetical protein|nr:hypothetical protein [Leptospiraceae bacterium]